MLVQKALCFLLIDAFLHGDEVFPRHQFVDLLGRIGSEADVAVGEDADEAPLRLPAQAAVFHDRNAGDAVRLHQAQSIRKRRIRADRDRIDDHAAFELLDLPDFFRLFGGRQVAVDDADTAGLCHGDREPRLGDGIHGRREDRKIEFDVLCDTGGDIRLARHHLGMPWLEQDVVEGQSLQTGCRFDDAAMASSSSNKRKIPGDAQRLVHRVTSRLVLEVGEGW